MEKRLEEMARVKGFCEGPVAGILLRRYGCRIVCLCGGCVAAAGFAVASLSDSIFVFMLCYGVIGGIGIGLNHLPGNVLVNTYFEKKRGIACGIVSSGAGFGVFVLAQVTEQLMDEYGWRGTVLLSGGIMLQFCVFATLLRPVLPKKNQSNLTSRSTSICLEDKDVFVSSQMPEQATIIHSEDEQIQNSRRHVSALRHVLDDVKTSKECACRSLLNISSSIKDPNSVLVSLPDLTTSKTSGVNIRYRSFTTHRANQQQHHHSNDPFLRKDIFFSGSLHYLKEYRDNTSIHTYINPMDVIESEDELSTNDDNDMTTARAQRIPRLFDPSVFKNGVYIPILIGAIMLQMGQFIPSTFIPEYCYTIDLTGRDASVIISVYGALNILGRLSAGCLANVRCVKSLWLCNFGALMCAICCVVFPLCTSFTTLCLFAVAFGYFIGYSAPLQYIILVEYLGLNKLTSAMGFLQLCKGPAALVGPPLAGVIFQWTQDYAMTVVFAGALFLLAACVQSIVPFTNRICTSGVSRNIEIHVGDPTNTYQDQK